MVQIGETLLVITKRLEQAGIYNARFEARLLLCHVLDVETQTLIAYPEREITAEQVNHLECLLVRRESREPMSHIMGEREFWSLPFKVTKDTLTPRPDSETLIEAVLRHCPDRTASLRVLDLGVGTGCLLLTVLSEYENAQGLGVDISPAALDVARENAKSLGLEGRSHFQAGNWGDAIEGTFDIVLSNPPYIALDDQDMLAPEVIDHEPATALFAGADGLDDYKRLAKCLPRLLHEKAIAVIELGIGQDKIVTEIMEKGGLSVIEAPKDLGAVVRCLVIRKKL